MIVQEAPDRVGAPVTSKLGGILQLRISFRGQALAAAAMLACGHATATASTPEGLVADQMVATAPPAAFDTFLDRLMAAESGGRSTAKNPRSTALGPFQFIKGTFLELTRRHFPAEISGLTEKEILKLRTDRDLSRRAAAVFCKESVDYLKGKGARAQLCASEARLSSRAGRCGAPHAGAAANARGAVAIAGGDQGKSFHAKHERDRSSRQERAGRNAGEKRVLLNHSQAGPIPQFVSKLRRCGGCLRRRAPRAAKQN